MKRFGMMDIFCSAVSTPDLQSVEDINYNDSSAHLFFKIESH